MPPARLPPMYGHGSGFASRSNSADWMRHHQQREPTLRPLSNAMWRRNLLQDFAVCLLGTKDARRHRDPRSRRSVGVPPPSHADRRRNRSIAPQWGKPLGAMRGHRLLFGKPARPTWPPSPGRGFGNGLHPTAPEADRSSSTWRHRLKIGATRTPRGPILATDRRTRWRKRILGRLASSASCAHRRP